MHQPKASDPAGRGAPAKHDCDAFDGTISWRVQDHSMPVSKGELVRDMMDWFAGREDFPPRDERAVRSRVWRSRISLGQTKARARH